MSEETDVGRVAGDPAEMLDHSDLLLPDGVIGFDRSSKTMDAAAQLIASGDICITRGSDLIVRETKL